MTEFDTYQGASTISLKTLDCTYETKNCNEISCTMQESTTTSATLKVFFVHYLWYTAGFKYTNYIKRYINILKKITLVMLCYEDSNLLC
jgi:type IV secretory pathway VirB6-like protein